MSGAGGASGGGRERRADVANALRWALAASTDPASASADWLAMDIDDACVSAVELLTSPSVTLVQLRQAKDAYKTMRIVGEKSSDRRLGARLYAAAIAAGLVWHGKRVSQQSDAALTRAFRALGEDTEVASELRDLAEQALDILERQRPAASGERLELMEDDDGDA